MYAGLMADRGRRQWTSRGGALAAIGVLHGVLLLVAVLWPAVRSIEPPALVAVSLLSVQPNARPVEIPAQVVRLETPAVAVPLPLFEVEAPVTESLTDVQVVDTRIAEPVRQVLEASPHATHQPVEVSRVEYVRPPVPRYPPAARRSLQQGVVQLRVLVGEDGRARDIELLRSSGHTLLDEAARQCVREALFRPYLLNGVARAVLVVVPIEFTLRRT
jgi:periplasmic protein TonB